MQTMMELLKAIDSKLERTDRLVAVQILLIFSMFIYHLTELCRKDKLVEEADEYDRYSVELLEEITQLKPDFGPAYAHIAYFFIDHREEKERLEQAVTLLENARKSPYLESDILTYSAKVLQKLGRYKEAFDKASIALKANPNNFEAYQISSYYKHLQRLEREPSYKKRGRRKKSEEAESNPVTTEEVNQGPELD